MTIHIIENTTVSTIISDINGLSGEKARQLCVDYGIPPDDLVDDLTEDNRSLLSEMLEIIDGDFRDIILSGDVAEVVEISKIPPIHVNDYLKTVEGVRVCYICFDTTGSSHTQISCGHEFCRECITKWISCFNSNCPVCRSDVIRQSLVITKTNHVSLNIC